MRFPENIFFKGALFFVVFSIVYFFSANFVLFSSAHPDGNKFSGTIVLVDDLKGINNSLVNTSTGNTGPGYRQAYLSNVLAPVALRGDSAEGACGVIVTGCCAGDYHVWAVGLQNTVRSLRFGSLPVVIQSIDNRLANCLVVRDNAVPPGLYDVDLSCGNSTYNLVAGGLSRGYGGTAGYLAVAYSCPA